MYLNSNVKRNGIIKKQTHPSFSETDKWFLKILLKKLGDNLSNLNQELIILYENKRYLKKSCGAFNKFPDFFVQAFKIVIDSWKLSMLLLYILWDDWPIFMISALNEQLQQQLEYTLQKPDCHSWWISKM